MPDFASSRSFWPAGRFSRGGAGNAVVFVPASYLKLMKVAVFAGKLKLVFDCAAVGLVFGRNATIYSYPHGARPPNTL